MREEDTEEYKIAHDNLLEYLKNNKNMNDLRLGTARNTLAEINVSSDARPAKRINAKPRNRVSLVPQEFDNIIEDQGVLTRITPVIICPNRTDLGDTNHPLECPLCGGDQVIEIPEQAKEDWVFIQSITNDKKFEVQGLFDIKDARATFKQKVRVYYWYKIEILHFATLFNQIIKRKSSGAVDNVRYAPATTTLDTPYNLIDSQGVRYIKDTDYTVSGRQLTWLSSHRPVGSTLYSFSYPVLPTFRVLETIHDNRYYYIDLKQPYKVPVQLPQQAIIRWDYLSKIQNTQL